MKKQLLLFTLALGMAHLALAQSIHDNSFREVVQITDREVFTNGSDFLFKRAVTGAGKPVVYVEENIPTELLTTIYPEFPELIVIMPNYPFYQKVAEETPPGMCAEPITSTLMYERRPGPKGAQIEERVLEGLHPDLTFRTGPEKRPGFLNVYLTETYATRRLPSEAPEAFLKLFKQHSGQQLRGIYTAVSGSQTTYYYTLEGMPDAARLQFLKARRTLSGGGTALFTYPQKVLFTPRLVPAPAGLQAWQSR